MIDETCEIHEQEIGSVVFSRPASYDTSQDNIVRVNASDMPSAPSSRRGAANRP